MSKCSIDNCNSPAKHKGLCGKHYKRQWRHGDPNKTLIDMERLPFPCSIPGCENLGRYPVTGMCHTHHLRFTRYGRTERIIAEQGKGRPLTGDGYVLITRNGNRVYEHIYIAERALGKPLPAGAIIHHMNEIKTDNYTPFNVVICPDQKYHKLLHKRTEEYNKFGQCFTLA